MKKITALVLILITVALTAAGCFFPFDKLTEQKDEILRPEEESTRIAGEFSDAESLVPEYGASRPVSAESKPDTESEGDIESYPDEEDIPVLYSLTEVRDYINGKKAQDVFDMSFEYVGYDELDGATIARISSACYVTYYIDGDNYEISLTEYPGDRIVDAYYNGDTSQLNSAEKCTLQTAEQMVKQALAEADSHMELEILLHDMLAERVTYYNGATDVPDPMDPPRHLTAVGALLDGSANCQGYTDGFYVLASIAGFEVGRMNVYDSEGWHILNTVLLDNEWYVVDVTFDDTVVYSDGVQPSYRLFNAGRDVCVEYQWGEEMEYYPITDRSDENYYYFLPDDGSEHGYAKAFEDIDEMARYLLEQFVYYGKSEFHTMLMDHTVDWTALEDALYNAGMNEISCSYNIWCFNTGKDTFYLIRFS